MVVRLFGVPSIEWNGVAVSSADGRSASSYPAMLALAEPDRHLSRKAIAAEMWPDYDDTGAAANLRRHLSHLSSVLPAVDDCIGRHGNDQWLHAAAHSWSDVVEFERGALDLYAANFMEGFDRILKGVGHNVPQEAPGDFADAIVSTDAL